MTLASHASSSLGFDSFRRALLESAALSVGFFVLAVLAGRPGWVSPDSLMMYAQATGDMPLSTWHTPTLIELWKVFLPSVTGPWGPFVTQQLLFWSGVFPVVLYLRLTIGRGAYILPVVLVATDGWWTSMWLWKDSAALSLLMVAIGAATCLRILHMLCSGRQRYFWILLNGRQRYFWLLLTLVLGGALGAVVVCRPYLFPAVALFGLGLSDWAGIVTLRRSSIQPTEFGRRFSVALLIASSLTVVASSVAVERWIVRPAEGYVSAIPMAGDILRTNCLRSTVIDPLASIGSFPGDLVIPGTGGLCKNFAILDPGPRVLWPVDPSDTHYRLPKNADEAGALRNAWLEAWQDSPALLIEARARVLVALLGPPTVWRPLMGESGRTVIGHGAVGDGKAIGWRSEGGLSLLLLVEIKELAAALLGPFASILSNGAGQVLLIPFVTAVILRRRKTLNAGSVALLLSPFAWVVNMALLVPGIDTRYISAAALAGIILSCLLLAALRVSGRRGQISHKP